MYAAGWPLWLNAPGQFGLWHLQLPDSPEHSPSLITADYSTASPPSPARDRNPHALC